MVVIVVSMVVILVLCGVIVVYVAFPHRGEDLPGAPWLGAALNRVAERFPVLAETHADPETGPERDADPRSTLARVDA